MALMVALGVSSSIMSSSCVVSLPFWLEPAMALCTSLPLVAIAICTYSLGSDLEVNLLFQPPDFACTRAFWRL